LIVTKLHRRGGCATGVSNQIHHRHCSHVLFRRLLLSSTPHFIPVRSYSFNTRSIQSLSRIDESSHSQTVSIPRYVATLSLVFRDRSNALKTLHLPAVPACRMAISTCLYRYPSRFTQLDRIVLTLYQQHGTTIRRKPDHHNHPTLFLSPHPYRRTFDHRPCLTNHLIILSTVPRWALSPWSLPLQCTTLISIPRRTSFLLSAH